MTPRRHGCRDWAWIAVLAACGCGGSPTSTRLTLSRPAAEAAKAIGEQPATLKLDPIPGSVSGVSEIVWGGVQAPRRIGVRLIDGRFAVYGIDGPTAPSRAGPPPGTAPIRALAILGRNRAATGDASGVTLWDTSGDPAKPLARTECGAVSALVVEGGSSGQTDLFAGRSDGRILRFRLVGDGGLDRPASERAGGSPSAVRRICVLPDRSRLVVLHDDGTAWTMRADLIGGANPLGSARHAAISEDGQWLARIVDGPCLQVERLDGGEPPRRFALPAPASTVAFAGGRSSMLVGAAGSVLSVPATEAGAFRLDEVREGDGYAGVAVVAADPAGTRIAVGDGSGRVELIEPETLARRGEPMSLDQVPEWAFRPEKRFARPSPRPGPASAKVDPRLDAAREAFRRGDTAESSALLKTLQDDPSSSPGAVGEALAMRAALDQSGGESSATVARTLDAARAAFAREGLVHRQADMEFWRALFWVRPFNREADHADPKSSEEAIGPLRRAASLYRQGPRPLERQAILCDAARAWALLDRGDLRSAKGLFARVDEVARVDPVLGHVVELGRTASALASASGDWVRAAAIDGRLLSRLPAGERPSLRREAALGRASALAALGRWRDAAATLEKNDPADPEWTLRRAACRLSAGLSVRPPSRSSRDDPSAAHLRALISLRDPSPDKAPMARVEADLALAAKGHRHAGREDLAIEADLARAELLERLDRHPQAAALYASVAAKVRAMNGDDRIRRASRPILDASPRALRGLARSELAAGRTGRALAAMEALAAVRSAELHGDRPAGVAALGLSAAEFPLAEALRHARTKLRRRGGPGGGAEADAAEIEVKRLQSALAGHDRPLAVTDPTAGIDVTALGLAEDEAMLVYGEAGPDSILGVLLRGSAVPIARRLPVGRGDLDRSLRAWRSSLGDGGRPLAPPSKADPAAILALGHEPDLPATGPPAAPGGPLASRLHDAMLRPFRKDMEGVTRLFVVPGPLLAATPLDVPGRDSGSPDRLSVSYLPACSFLPALRDGQRIERPADFRALFIAPDGRRGTEALVASLRPAPGSVEQWRGPQARADRFMSERLTAFAGIHLASGAVFGPLRSASGESEICLAGGGKPPLNDGRLSARDLSEVPLRARVLALAVSDIEGADGEGLLALARAGLLTGAECVLLTLWEPPAESSNRFFAAFYRSLASGSPAVKALADARAAVTREPKFRDPVHWAGYVLYGG